MRRAMLLGLVGCVAEVGSVPEPGEDPVAVDEGPSESTDDPAETGTIAATTDSFACVRPEQPSSTNGGYSCSGSPNLVFSTLCAEGASYHVSLDASAPDMTMAVIAPHGGKIEPNTDVIALGLADELDLPHFVFVAHATASCLDKYGGPTRSNHRALHITSVHFNDVRAESLMRSVNRGVSVHGHGRSKHKICVGGITPALRTAFKSYYDTYAKKHSPSGTSAVIATADADCEGIAGTARANISNRSKVGAGLQLELSSTFRSELVASKRGDRLLWTSFRNAVRAACRVSIDGVRGCGA
jgi:phage replication-related protein YjqB (UPF0714/DUF867 family)